MGAFTAKGEVLDLLENETGMHSCLERKTQASPVGAGGKRKHPDGAASDVDTFHVYIRCFAAWELERPKGGDSGQTVLLV